MPPTDAHTLFLWMWLCYDAGRADATGEQPLEMEPGDAAIVNIVRADWKLRMERLEVREPRAPAWLTACQEAHEPAPWSEP